MKCTRSLVLILAGALASAALVGTSPAQANPAGTGMVINEADVNGGSSGAGYQNQFVDAPTPTNAGGAGPVDPGQPTEHSIAEIQGSTDTSPVVGQQVITTGVVTAVYATGGFNGFYLQTGGSGGSQDATPGSSDAVFVYSSGTDTVDRVALGDSVRVTGAVTEFSGMTELTPGSAADVTKVAPLDPIKATDIDFPATDAAREALEGMLLHPSGSYTVTGNYSTSSYAEISLALGDTPLFVPTEVARPQTDEAAAVVANNAAKKVVLDDGASINYLTSGRDTPLPWLTHSGSVRVGEHATFTSDVILDYRNAAWKFQPLEQLTADDTNAVMPVRFTGGQRPTGPEKVGGDIRLGTFNVLNYFNTTGADYTASTQLACTYYRDRAGNPVTVNTCTGDQGPRGAADAASLTRQQAKIVHAINTLGADVVSLEEIENSVKFGQDRDDALARLVTALNADAGTGTWAYVHSPDPAHLPATADQDLIRTAFIYKPTELAPTGESTVLVGSAAFANAREPLAQAFTPTHGTDADTFVVIVNHFKSKGSGADDGTGQGDANPDRVAQAHALVSFAADMSARYGTAELFLTGDFNSYSEEDPVQVVKDAGFRDLEAEHTTKDTYAFGGEVGSLDHIYASAAADAAVTGLDVWNINAYEPVAYEYSRFNDNATNFYTDSPYRASDHDPVLVGIRIAPVVSPPAATVHARSVADQRTERVSVAAYAQNTDTVPLDILFTTPTGATVTFSQVAPGSTVYHLFSTDNGHLDAGVVKVATYKYVNGQGYSKTYDAHYRAATATHDPTGAVSADSIKLHGRVRVTGSFANTGADPVSVRLRTPWGDSAAQTVEPGQRASFTVATHKAHIETISGLIAAYKHVDGRGYYSAFTVTFPKK